MRLRSHRVTSLFLVKHEAQVDFARVALVGVGDDPHAFEGHCHRDRSGFERLTGWRAAAFAGPQGERHGLLPAPSPRQEAEDSAPLVRGLPRGELARNIVQIYAPWHAPVVSAFALSRTVLIQIGVARHDE